MCSPNLPVWTANGPSGVRRFRKNGQQRHALARERVGEQVGNVAPREGNTDERPKKLRDGKVDDASREERMQAATMPKLPPEHGGHRSERSHEAQHAPLPPEPVARQRTSGMIEIGEQGGEGNNRRRRRERHEVTLGMGHDARQRARRPLPDGPPTGAGDDDVTMREHDPLLRCGGQRRLSDSSPCTIG